MDARRLLSDLTPAQRDAVTHGRGPLLVLAGAGSGKTRVITRRVAYLISQGIDPRSILAITFTNKAAGEMAERIEVLTSGARVWVSTFHSFCARTLRRYARWVGIDPRFSILDQSDSLVAVREALQETGTDPKLYGAPKVLAAIAAEKDRLRTPEQTQADACSQFEASVARAYAYYQDLLAQSDAVDFSDLLVKTVELLRIEEVGAVLRDRFRYLLIDEYQDTNHVQYELVRLLGQEHRNVCATGDPDQSIYGWRGADIANILRFEQDYPEARVVKLEENFRSTGHILAAANGLIRHNTERREKELRTAGPEGEPLRYRIHHDDHDEARYVARAVVERVVGDGVPRSEVAVFYRTGACSRALETAFQERGIPYRVVGSLAFYQRREIKDVLCYLRVIHNPRDDVALQRVINVPPRGIGKQTLGRLRARARRESCSLYEACRLLAAEGALKGRSREGMRSLLDLVEGLQALAAQETAVEELIRRLLEETRYREYLVRTFPRDEEDRLLNLASLLAGARDFDRRFALRGPDARTTSPAPPPPRTNGEDT
ncbi:MAG: hypothetical protein D6731_05865, partial [Planctomycetota bacterium]